jgi:hypothetical protein
MLLHLRGMQMENIYILWPVPIMPSLRWLDMSSIERPAAPVSVFNRFEKGEAISVTPGS